MSTMMGQERQGELPERWSAKGKVEVVLRLLRGEAVEAVSRELQVPPTSWRRGGACSWKREWRGSRRAGIPRRGR